MIVVSVIIILKSMTSVEIKEKDVYYCIALILQFHSSDGVYIHVHAQLYMHA